MRTTSHGGRNRRGPDICLPKMQPEHHRPPHGATGKREDASASEMVDGGGRRGGRRAYRRWSADLAKPSAAGIFNRVRENQGGEISSVAAALPGDLADGLLLCFDFDKAPVAGKVPDLSGQGNDGKAVNVQWVADGHRGGSVVFGDSNSYITVPNNQGLNPPQFTLAAWIKTSFKDKAWRRVFDKSWDHGYDITMGGDDGGKSYQGQVTMEVAGAGAGTRGPVTDGRWHQVVGTFNAKELVFYLDGRRAGSARAKQQPAPTMYRSHDRRKSFRSSGRNWPFLCRHDG